MADLTLALFQPDIPQNAGTMLRACACLGVDAAIIEPAGFLVSDRNFRRAGMDYLDRLRIDRHVSWSAFEDWRRGPGGGGRLVLLTARATLPYAAAEYRPGDILMVGRESLGAPPEVHEAADLRVTIPMVPNMRSLNVAFAAAMVMGEALRQIRGNPGAP